MLDAERRELAACKSESFVIQSEIERGGTGMLSSHDSDNSVRLDNDTASSSSVMDMMRMMMIVMMMMMKMMMMMVMKMMMMMIMIKSRSWIRKNKHSMMLW